MCGLDKQFITHIVPEAVVDHFEVVDIQEEYRVQIAQLPLPTLKALPQAIQEQRPIGQVRERVVPSIVTQSILGLVPYGDFPLELFLLLLKLRRAFPHLDLERFFLALELRGAFPHPVRGPGPGRILRLQWR